AKRGGVLNFCAIWDHARRLLARGSIAAGFGLFAAVFCSMQALAVEPAGDAAAPSTGVSDPNAGLPSEPPFTGNPELKARLDLPGRLIVAGERTREQLLRRFYAAHGYQTIWTGRSAEASQLWNTVLRAGDHGLDPALFHSGAIVE